MTIITVDMEKNLREIARVTDKSLVQEAIGFAAELLVGEASRRAPVEFGALQNSDVVEKPRGRSVKFGFNARYSAIMDSGWKTKYIYPRRAKALFVPISRRAKRYGSRARAPRSLKYGKDFLLLKRVGPMPVAVKGRSQGPNKYFSGTIEDKRAAAARVIAQKFDAGIERATKS
jgi:hypothetical protein